MSATAFCQIHKGRFLDVLPSLPPVQCIVTDPAYWTLDKWRNIGTTTRLGGHRDADKQDAEAWFETIDRTELWEHLCTFCAILPKNAHCWICADWETAWHIGGMVDGLAKESAEIDQAGAKPLDCWSYQKAYPVLKRTMSGEGFRQGMGYHGRASHEWVILAKKGSHPMSDRNWPDVFEFPWTGDAESARFTPHGKKYPTAKPVAFFRRLVELSTKPGDTVLDPFGGSGTLIEAALPIGRNVVTCDPSPIAIETMTRRLEYVRTNSQPAPKVPQVRGQQILSDSQLSIGF